VSDLPQSKSYDACGRPYCDICKCFHNARHEPRPDGDGWCYKHDKYHKPHNSDLYNTGEVKKGRVEWARELRSRILLFSEDNKLLHIGEWQTNLITTAKYADRLYIGWHGDVYELIPLEKAE